MGVIDRVSVISGESVPVENRAIVTIGCLHIRVRQSACNKMAATGIFIDGYGATSVLCNRSSERCYQRGR